MAPTFKLFVTMLLLLVLLTSTEMGPMMLGESWQCDDYSKSCAFRAPDFCTKWCKKKGGYDLGRCFEFNCCCFPPKPKP
nr:defensin-like protein P322 [Ipomoea batatas]